MWLLFSELYFWFCIVVPYLKAAIAAAEELKDHSIEKNLSLPMMMSEYENPVTIPDYQYVEYHNEKFVVCSFGISVNIQFNSS